MLAVAVAEDARQAAAAFPPDAGDEPVEPTLRFVDLFARISGIRLGLQRAGGRCVYSVELDPHARRPYEAVGIGFRVFRV